MEASLTHLGRENLSRNQQPGKDRSGPEMARKYVTLFWHFVVGRDLVRFGWDDFERRGYQPHFVSCLKAIYSDRAAVRETDSFRNHPRAIAPETRDDLEAFFDTLAPTDFILVMVPLTPETLWIFQALDRRGLRYSMIWLGKYPSRFPFEFTSVATTRRSLVTAVRETVRFLRRLRDRCKLAIAHGLSYFRLRGPMFYIRGGAFELWLYPLVPHLRRAEVVDVESFETGWLRLAETQGRPTPPRPFAVFLDEAMGHHPDWAFEGGQPENMPAINADIRRSLAKIEQDTGLPVVIALHPKSDYSKEAFEEVYGHRLAVKDNTAALVRDADLVISHASTSNIMAVICRKPIMFMTNRFIRASRDGLYIDFLAAWLGQAPVEMEHLIRADAPPVSVPEINEVGYARFMSKFVRTPSAHRGPFWDHVIDRFETRIGRPETGTRLFPEPATAAARRG